MSERLLCLSATGGVRAIEVVIGLVHAYRSAGKSVSAVVLGPHHQVAVVLRRLCGRYIRCIDVERSDTEEILSEFQRAEMGADIVLVLSLLGAHEEKLKEISKLLEIASLEVVEDRSLGQALSAYLFGLSKCESFHSPNGFVLVSSEELPWLEGLGSLNLPPVVAKTSGSDISVLAGIEGASGVVNRTALSRQYLVESSKAFSGSDALTQLEGITAQPSELRKTSRYGTSFSRRARIAVSDDVCFSLGYQSNLELLLHYGAELVPFSPLADIRLPRDIQGVYLCSGYVPVYGEELSQNNAIRSALLEFAARGGLIYSEGGATAYLSREYQLGSEGAYSEGIGLIPAVAKGLAEGEGYGELRTERPTPLLDRATSVRAYYPFEWNFVEEEGLQSLGEVTYCDGRRFRDCFVVGGNLLATFSLPNFASNPGIAENLVSRAGEGERVTV